MHADLFSRLDRVGSRSNLAPWLIDVTRFVRGQTLKEMFTVSMVIPARLTIDPCHSFPVMVRPDRTITLTIALKQMVR
jgi:hypothetical protein